MKYCDLAQVGTGTGIESDPYNFTQFLTVPKDDDFKLKGIVDRSQEIPEFDIDLGGHTVSNWLTNEPWRINFIDPLGEGFFLLSHGTIVNGMFNLLQIGGSGLTLINCFVRSVLEGIANAYGCTLSTTSVVLGGVVQDCIVNGYAGGTGTYNNCAIFDDEFPPQNSVDCQLGWTPPAMPAWDAPKEEFDAALLSVGINTPPQPGFGAPDYTGYETGLWGNPRTGIGAMYFEAPTPPTPDDVFTARMDAKFSNQKKVTDLQNNVTKMGPITTAKDGRIKGGSKIDYTFNG